MDRPGDSRKALALSIRHRSSAREREEFNRIAQQLRSHQTLDKFEMKLLLEGLDGPKSKVGAPSLFSGPHRFMAIHYWWLRKSRKLTAARAKALIAPAWGVSQSTVTFYATGADHRANAIEWVDKAIAESMTRPAHAIEQMIAMVAEGFRQFGSPTENIIS